MTEPQAQKYDLILEAALRIFSAKGFHETKVTEIAKEAGVGDGTIYSYFKSKDDILISLFETQLESINAGLSRGLDQITEPVAQLDYVIKYHLQLALEHPELASFITVELRRSAKFMKEYAKEQLSQYLGQILRVLDHGKSQGSFRSDLSTGIASQIIFGALDHACVVWVSNPKRKADDLKSVGDELARLIKQGICTASNRP